jgi:serine/threonine-protein kinase SRPK3
MDEHAFLQRISEPAEYFEEGRAHCLTLVDSFDIVREDDSGSHHCLVTEVLGKTLVHVRREYPKRIVPLPLFKTVLRNILRALNYLHVECDIIHTGIGFLFCAYWQSHSFL